MKKKVLLMGASGSGKTSMRSLIFSNNPASLTSRLGVTTDVEQNHVRFLGDLILNLWDCGGQDSYMQQYLSTQQATIFASVGVLIYVFEIKSRDAVSDAEYFRRILDALKRYSPGADVFILVHKMDLVGQGRDRQLAFENKKKELLKEAGAVAPGLNIQIFGTSIYDESLYRAWSRVVHSLIPNVATLSRHLTTFAEVCSATEVVLFERTTFLVIATSEIVPPSASDMAPPLTPQADAPSPSNATPSSHFSLASATDSAVSSVSEASASAGLTDAATLHGLEPTRYERTSELIKAFKQSCARMRSEFHSLEFEFPEFTAVLDELTKNMYVLVVVHNPNIETAALRINIELARHKFEELQSESTLG